MSVAWTVRLRIFDTLVVPRLSWYHSLFAVHTCGYMGHHGHGQAEVVHTCTHACTHSLTPGYLRGCTHPCTHEHAHSHLGTVQVYHGCVSGTGCVRRAWQFVGACTGMRVCQQSMAGPAHRSLQRWGSRHSCRGAVERGGASPAGPPHNNGSRTA